MSSATSAESLAQRVWQRYTQGSGAQVRAVSRFEELSLEAKPSAYEHADPAEWKRMESEVKRLVGQEIRMHIAVQRPNRLYIEQKSAFGWFRSVCDGKVWQVRRQDGMTQRISAPATLREMSGARFRPWLGLDGSSDVEVLQLLLVHSPILHSKLLRAKEQPGANPNQRCLVWSEPIAYQGLHGQGTIKCVVDVRTAQIQRVEYRFNVGYGAEAWLNMAIGQQWDNSLLSKPAPTSLFRLEQGRGPRTR